MLNAQLVDRIGWTLIHSVWQIILLAYVVAVCNRCLFGKSANSRYLVGCIALSAMIVLPTATFFLVPPAADNPTFLPVEASEAIVGDAHEGVALALSQRASDVLASQMLAESEDDVGQEHGQDEATGAKPAVVGTWRDRIVAWLQPATSSIAMTWFVGVLLLSARPLFGLYTIRRLRCVGRSDPSEKVLAIVRRLCVRMGIDKTIEVAESILLEVPAVLGSLRPLLLLPATAVTGLTPQQLEAVIAHELAHVRRHDYIVNFLQTIVETLLFYHPAVWWVSAQMRRERENCCDDIAVTVCNDRAAYAKSLVVLDELRRTPRAVVAANGGSLLQRIRRLAGSDQQKHSSTPLLASALLLVAMLVGAVSTITVTTEAVAEDAANSNVRLRVRDAEGKRMTRRVDWQSAYRGYRKEMPNKFYTSDERGRLDLELDPGKHTIVTSPSRPNATIVELDVPRQGLRRKVRLNAKPAGHPGPNGYPDLNVKAEVRAGEHVGEQFIVLKISSNKDEAYTLHQNDLSFTTTDVRVLPPKSQQQTGLVIPPRGEVKTITLAWHEYVRDGIWTARNEPMSEPWPAIAAKPGRHWFRPNVGITGSLPIQVTMPEVILDPKSVDPRSLRVYMGGLRGRFVFDGERPVPKRITAGPRAALDGTEFSLKDDDVLKQNEVFDESLVVGKNGGVANVVVWIRSKDVPVPLVDKPHGSLRMKAGRYDPHITLLQMGQDFSISNEHKFATNWHLEANDNQPVNILLPANYAISHPLPKAERVPVRMMSNIHPWLSGWLVVKDNPFFAVSDEDGAFEIKALPPGEWEFQFWHEKSGYLAREGWPKGRVTIKIDKATHNLGAIKLTADDLDSNKQTRDPPKATPQQDASKPSPPGFTGSLTGRFVFDGKPPRRRLYSIDKDKAALGGNLLYDESLVVAESGGIENVVVWAHSRDIPLPPEDEADPSVTMHSDGGRFEPHLLAMRSNQKLVVENNDPVAHNFNVRTIRQDGVNFLLPAKGGRVETRFKETMLPVRVTCNIHPWMNAWLFVRDDPYFAHTGPDGTFTIKNLPPGEWEFVFWHEKTGYVKNKSGWPRGRQDIKIGLGASHLGTVKLSYEDFDLEEPAEIKQIGELDGIHPIWVAAQAGDKKRIRQLLSQEPELVNWRNQTGFAPLHWAAMQKTPAAARLLLELGANVSVKQAKYGGSPLQYAASDGTVEICQLLLSYDAAVDQPDNFGLTPLMRAAMEGKVDAARLLIEHGADVNARANSVGGSASWSGGTALHFATARKHPKVVRLLLDHGADPKALNDAGQSSIKPASEKPPKPAATPQFYAKQDGGSRLAAAITGGDNERLKRILEQTPKVVNALDQTGFTPLHIAAQNGRTEAAELLLEAGASVTAKQTQYGGTPLQYAASKGHVEICKLLLSHDAAVDATDKFGRTPLMWAAMHGKTEVAALLIEHGADVNARTTARTPGSESGKDSTALHFAVEKKHDATVELLLKQGADATIRNSASKTADGARPPSDWFRNAPFPEIGFFQPDEFERTALRIATHPPAIRELGVSDEHAAVLKKLGAWARQDVRDVKADNREGRKAVWNKALQRASEMLTNWQRRRLTQLVLQQRRHEVFLNPELMPALELTAEQHRNVKDMWNDHLARLKANEKKPEADIKGRESYRRFWMEVREILTEQQRATFEKLRGPPVQPTRPPANQESSADQPAIDAVGIVKQVGEGQEFVELSTGSVDGLIKGMRLDVYREKTYLGRVEVVRTTQDESVARIVKEYRRGAIKVGDEVTNQSTGIELAPDPVSVIVDAPKETRLGETIEVRVTATNRSDEKIQLKLMVGVDSDTLLPKQASEGFHHAAFVGASEAALEPKGESVLPKQVSDRSYLQHGLKPHQYLSWQVALEPGESVVRTVQCSALKVDPIAEVLVTAAVGQWRRTTGAFTAIEDAQDIVPSRQKTGESNKEAPPREKIGEVFGEPVYRDQLPTEDNDGRAVRNQLHRLLLTPVMKRYRKEHAEEIELTEQEILEAIEFCEARAEESSAKDAERWNNMAKRTSLTFFLGNLKFQRHLYDEFGGGRVLFQQAGLEAFDATHNWLLKHEKSGDFKVDDPELRAKLFEYWTRDHGAFLQGDKDKSDPDALTLKGIYKYGEQQN
jgi:ankyrin repeat protein/beta-lactamase regulating signal transducer with metallopeptidase domain